MATKQPAVKVRGGSHSSLLPGFVLWPWCCSQNELKFGTETKADPLMSRQTLRETILTESQLQDSEKHKQSAVVWSGLSCDTEASHHRHPLFLSLLSVYWSFGWSNVCRVWSTGQAWAPLQQPHANSCYHQWLRWHFYQRTNTNGAEIEKYSVLYHKWHTFLPSTPPYLSHA